MSAPPLKIVTLGLSITSSWGNGHATTYRGLMRELAARGHDVLFLERDVPWYAENRDLPHPPYGRTELYSSREELQDRFTQTVREADFVMLGSFVPEGVAVAEWILQTAGGRKGFYDIDTPVTLAKLRRGENEYISPALIPRFDVYLSFTGGPILSRVEREYGAPSARVLYCSIDPALYYPEDKQPVWDLGYLGTYSDDRQPMLELLMLEPARSWKQGRFAVVGPLYPDSIVWPHNLDRVQHLSPREHRNFYNSQRFTLNVTRADMVRAGFSPSVRLFEAGACGTPIITDCWNGLSAILEPGREILVSTSPQETLGYLCLMPETERQAVGKRARARILAQHTSAHRASELETYILELYGRNRAKVAFGNWPRNGSGVNALAAGNSRLLSKADGGC